MSDYMLNKAGAKIFKDVSKHKELAIPVLKSDSENGKTYNVLSIGFLNRTIPIATVKISNSIIAYKLPMELNGWVLDIINISMNGTKMFPSKVEFGNLDGRIYAEIL